jgi:molybdate-binding protein/DNA-binding XRE family transcriptional regulator
MICHLRAIRLARELSQSELAGRVGVKRQAIYDLEAGRYLPNTALALRLAGVLDCKVEDLFSLKEADREEPASLVGPVGPEGSRVSVARVREKLVAFGLGGKWMLSEGLQPADGLLQPGGGVRLLRDEKELERQALLLGCDPAFAILSAHVSRRVPEVRLQSRFASSLKALHELAAGHTHLAALHLHNSGAGEANLEAARRTLAAAPARLIAFSVFEEGLMVAPGNPLRIKTVSDLATPGVRFVNRGRGAALRLLLDERLQQARISPEHLDGYQRLVSSHLEGARLVALQAADAALGLRAVAVATGLDFVPLEVVRCDLVIPHDLQGHPAVKVLLEVLQTDAWRRELAALPGYESSCTGTVVGEI